MDRITELERENAALQARLANAEKDLEVFLYTVSHDFRGPLRAIMSSAMILREDYGEALDSSGREELTRQSKAAKQLSTMLDDLLKISRLGRQAYTPVPVDVTALAQSIAPSAKVQEGMTAVCDPKWLNTLFDALVDNAVKHSDGDAKIEIGQDEESFFVRDQGIGFEPEQSDRIFNPFEKITNRSQGTGMGLSNARVIVQKHGGRIWAESKPGEGATFRFTLGA